MEKNDRDYSNGEITVHWKPSACVHSTICYTKLRKVFDPIKRPWVNIHGASSEEIIQIVNECPTDALTFSWNDKTKEPENKESNSASQEKTTSTKIQIMENGPAIITGDFSINDINGVELKSVDTVALCRCGKSSRMPFCDGTHNNSDFKEARD